jgi:hypothetical protein
VTKALQQADGFLANHGISARTPLFTVYVNSFRAWSETDVQNEKNQITCLFDGEADTVLDGLMQKMDAPRALTNVRHKFVKLSTLCFDFFLTKSLIGSQPDLIQGAMYVALCQEMERLKLEAFTHAGEINQVDEHEIDAVISALRIYRRRTQQIARTGSSFLKDSWFTAYLVIPALMEVDAETGTPDPEYAPPVHPVPQGASTSNTISTSNRASAATAPGPTPTSTTSDRASVSTSNRDPNPEPETNFALKRYGLGTQYILS